MDNINQYEHGDVITHGTPTENYKAIFSIYSGIIQA